MVEAPKHRHPAGAALYRLIGELLRSQHRLRAADRRLGAVDGGGGRWGLMRSLVEEGPQSVPALARARPVARQHIQTMVNALAQERLVELDANPAHKRSRLVRATPAGERWFAEVDARVRAAADELAIGMDPDALAAAGRVVAALNDRLLDGEDRGIEKNDN